MSDSSSAAPELPLLLGPLGSEAESLMLIGALEPSGVVHVRIWSAENWSAPVRTRAERAATLLSWLEDQGRAGRSMNQSLYALRLWLRGEGSTTG